MSFDEEEVFGETTEKAGSGGLVVLPPKTVDEDKPGVSFEIMKKLGVFELPGNFLADKAVDQNEIKPI